ncbi:MAG: rRNA pseudouridine synthase [Lachnospiraceae bacterium]|nr:rRNA pseudouridine synthase [Lachnospiraceae bacterium]
MRLDKFLCDCNLGTRSQIKKDIKAGLVTVNAHAVRRPEQHIDEKADKVYYKGQFCSYEPYVYYMLHKPAGIVSATEDQHDQTVLDLFGEDRRNDLFPVGRLDKDTEGLLLITNDGVLAHELLSPSKHVEKEYECHLEKPFDEKQKVLLEQGVDIGEKSLTKPAVVRILEDNKITLTITEGKFHQVKRMLHTVGNEVTYLKRIRMGTLTLDSELPRGSYRRLTEEEKERLGENK